MIKELIINNLDLIITIAIGVISCIITLIQSKKGTKKANIIECMINYIQEAEAYKCKNGQTVDGNVKKEIVLSKIEDCCVKLKLKFNRQYWSTLIDTYVAFTKNVNSKDTVSDAPINDTSIQEEIKNDIENNVTNEIIDI